MLLSTLQTRELGIIRNNAFRCIFNCCWRKSVKSLQFYCNTVPLTYIADQRKLLSIVNSHSVRMLYSELWYVCLVNLLITMFLCSEYGVRRTSARNDNRCSSWYHWQKVGNNYL